MDLFVLLFLFKGYFLTFAESCYLFQHNEVEEHTFETFRTNKRHLFC